MNNRFIIMLIIALVLAAGAAWMAKRWVDSQTTHKADSVDGNMVNVYAAATNIPFATRIDKSQIKLMAWPKSSVPSEAFTEADIQADPNAIIGKVTQREFYADEILLKPHVKEHAGGSTLSALIKEGMRAISVRVNDVAGVAGFILPGNKADIIASRGSQGETYTLLKNVKILAIDQTASTDQDKPTVVRALTLEVTPKQAEILVQAMQSGNLQFTLRNPMDSGSDIHIETVKTRPDTSESKTIAPYTPYKAPVTIKVLPWGSQKFIECQEGAAC
ncbi:MAG: Flp pilus assembly protein CpaB [Gammaproteobacteria bacterium]